MQVATVARNYAEALLELAVADGEVELYAEQLGEIVGLMETESDFRLFLETPRIDAAEKKRVLSEVFAAGIPSRLLRFLLVVIDKGRQRLLPQIAVEFGELVNEHFGRLQVQVTLADEPDETLKAELKERLDRLLETEVLPYYRIDPRILGGVVIRVGDRIMDGSIRHRLQTLRRSLLKAELA